ncbi:hypothetical protein [Burkholderia sp. ABCPW 14]|uniref:hypothetical protein n=1 Tax=Burkholderia sp. ABCPW 14 TaxID=1637860 RepID=UPI000AD6B343|nr:hypothetical protein [Burkholderia sp. ABCPW 14]
MSGLDERSRSLEFETAARMVSGASRLPIGSGFAAGPITGSRRMKGQGLPPDETPLDDDDGRTN